MRVISHLEGNADSRNDFHGNGISFLYEFILFQDSLKESRRDFLENPFGKGKRSNFSLFERKVTKEANQRAAGLLASMETVYRKAHSTLRESTMLKHCYYSLGERVFRRSWFFGVF